MNGSLIFRHIWYIFVPKVYFILTPAYPSYLPDPFFAQRSMPV